MSILFNILLFLHVVVCLLLVLLVMMQRPKQEGLGAAFASGMMSESFGAQTTDVLQKGTRFLAICFFVLAVLLAVIKAQQNRNILPEIQPAAVVPGEPALPNIDLAPETMPAVPSLPDTATTPETVETTPDSDAAAEAPAEKAPESPAEPEAAEEAATPDPETEVEPTEPDAASADSAATENKSPQE
tara:strand:+ start:1251 stop:1811 length:561 start_codon:yes stop_codon:yes gene_type:complete